MYGNEHTMHTRKCASDIILRPPTRNPGPIRSFLGRRIARVAQTARSTHAALLTGRQSPPDPPVADVGPPCVLPLHLSPVTRCPAAHNELGRPRVVTDRPRPAGGAGACGSSSPG